MNTDFLKPLGDYLQRFFVRADPQHDAFVKNFQAVSATSRITFLFYHLLPGIIAYALINIPVIYYSIANLTGLPGTLLQYLYLVGFTLIWHLFLPMIILQKVDGLSFRESLAFLGLDHFDTKGVFLVMPVTLGLFILISYPYIQLTYIPLQDWVSGIPGLRTPEYSIFQENRIYAFPPILLAFLGIGNYLGEEIYYRGYLLKKIGFSGSWAWVINSVLFSIYHLWQAPQTWPILPLSLFFGLLMQLRKNLYPLIFFHIAVNSLLGIIIGRLFTK